jgi:hypothetical protein
MRHAQSRRGDFQRGLGVCAGAAGQESAERRSGDGRALLFGNLVIVPPDMAKQ